MRWFSRQRYKEQFEAERAAEIAAIKEVERQWREEYERTAVRFLVVHAKLTKLGYPIGTEVPQPLTGLNFARYVGVAERALAELEQTCAD